MTDRAAPPAQTDLGLIGRPLAVLTQGGFFAWFSFIEFRPS